MGKVYSDGNNDFKKVYSEGNSDGKNIWWRQQRWEKCIVKAASTSKVYSYIDGNNDEQDGAMGMTTRKANNDVNYDEHVVLTATITSKAVW